MSVLNFPNEREACLLNHAGALRAIERCMGDHSLDVSSQRNATHQLSHRLGGDAPSPVGLDDGVADL